MNDEQIVSDVISRINDVLTDTIRKAVALEITRNDVCGKMMIEAFISRDYVKISAYAQAIVILDELNSSIKAGKVIDKVIEKINCTKPLGKYTNDELDHLYKGIVANLRGDYPLNAVTAEMIQRGLM